MKLVALYMYTHTYMHTEKYKRFYRYVSPVMQSILLRASFSKEI